MFPQRNLQGRGSKSAAQHAAAVDEDQEDSDEAAEEELDVEDGESEESEDEKMAEDGEVEVQQLAHMNKVESAAAAAETPTLDAASTDTQVGWLLLVIFISICVLMNSNF